MAAADNVLTEAGDSWETNWGLLEDRTTLLSREVVLEMAVRLSYQVPGNIIEFGVAEGGSTRLIRRVATECDKRYPPEAKKRIYACDSFEGLPEKYENAEVGTFATEPPVIPGVEIVKGYFEDSLTPALAGTVGSVALASLDADLYSSTRCALGWLTPLLHTGSLLLFDEFIGEKESEKRALEDWAAETGTKTFKLAEFVRDPSGWGSAPDRRTLYQVVGNDALVCNQPVSSGGGYLSHQVGRLKGGLSRYPALYNATRGLYRTVKR